jgi:CRP-like cAMP-binding protein
MFTLKSETSRFTENEVLLTSIIDEGRSLYNNVVPLQIYPSGVELYSQGSSAQEVYFIDRGLVKLIHLCPGGEELIVDLRSSGWTLGAASVILRKPYPVTVSTLSPCYLRRIPQETFLSLMNTNTQLCWHLQQMHSLEVHNKAAQLARLAYLPAQQRFEQFLLDLISALELKESPKGIRLQLPLRHWEIAELIAVTPAYVSRLLNKMETDGFLIRDKGWLIISDLSKILGYYGLEKTQA